MVPTGRHLWGKHPGVRSDDQLSRGERAADHLKAGFGSWPFIIVLNVVIVAWILIQTFLGKGAFDPYPWLLLNIGLSWLAAQQGGALQIAANRGDRISSELALHTEQNTDDIKTLLTANTALTEQVHALATTIAGQTATLDEIHRHVSAMAPQAGSFPPPQAARAKRLATPADRGKMAAPKTAPGAKPQPKGTRP
jgi:uncharacterized membrane protein